MKKEDITGLIVYLIIIAFAIVFGLTVLQAHNSESTLSGIFYVLYIIGAVVVGALFNAILFELAHIVGAKIGKYEILSVNILGLCFYKDSGKRKVRFASFDGLTGETKIVPKEGMVEKANPYPYLFLGSIFFVVEAVIVMVDANIQREDILPSEKARAYRMKYETMKHQGMRSGGLSLDSLGAAAGESGKTVQRYLWLSRLIDGLMELVDRRKMTLVCGIDLSWLSQEAQSWVFECLSKGMKINKQKTERLKVYSERGDLTEDGVINILSDQREKPRSFVMSEDVVRRYFGDKYTVEEMTSIICELLKEWKQRECTDI